MLRERLVALFAVVILPLALRVLSLDRTLALCDRWPVLSTRPASPVGLADRARRWLGHGWGPWRASCLTRSIVLYTMLRTHGYTPRLHIGVAGRAAEFVAHSWVSLGGQPVADRGDDVDGYQELLAHGD